MFASMFAPTLALAAAGSDPVVAERGSLDITANQARALVSATDGALRRRLTTDPAALEAFLRNLLLQRAVLGEARAQKWEQRADVAAALQRARDQVIAQSFLAAQAPLPAGYPSEADIQSAYAQNRAQLMQPRTYHVTQLFIPATATHDDDGRRRLAEWQAKLAHSHANFDTAFGNVAGAHYADLGFLPETSLIEPVKTAVAGMLEGTVSEPVCTPEGCALIHLLATRPAGPAPVADVHDRLADALRQRRVSQEEQAYANTLLAHEPIRLNDVQLAHLAVDEARGGPAP